ncbi:MAG: cytochrome b [Zavarzinia sp.]|nr:cytochrome b [Zavarzinia sp.]
MTTPIPSPVKLVHWSVVLLLLALFAIAWTVDEFEAGPFKSSLIDLHRSLGLVVFVLALIRPLLRFTLGGVERAGRSLTDLAASGIHIALYGALIAMPLAGWIFTSANGGPAKVFGIPVPDLVGKDDTIADLAYGAHEILGNLILIAVGVHVAAALWHHFVQRDDVLRRMLPGRP